MTPTTTTTTSGAADLPEARLFTKKPVTISATQWFKNGDHPQVRAIAPSDDLFFTGMGGAMLTGREKYGVIGTLESPNHLVTPGDWIITGVAGEHYACKPDIFEATYSPAALAAGQATAAQAGVQDDLITLRKPTTSAEMLWLLKLAHLVISDVDKALEETFAPAQPAAQQGAASKEASMALTPEQIDRLIQQADGLAPKEGSIFRALAKLTEAEVRKQDDALIQQPEALRLAAPLTDEQIKALMRAHRTAMLMTCKARVPECGEFAAIAQDLDWLCESFGIKGGQHGTELQRLPPRQADWQMHGLRH